MTIKRNRQRGLNLSKNQKPKPMTCSVHVTFSSHVINKSWILNLPIFFTILVLFIFPTRMEFSIAININKSYLFNPKKPKCSSLKTKNHTQKIGRSKIQGLLLTYDEQDTFTRQITKPKFLLFSIFVHTWRFHTGQT